MHPGASYIHGSEAGFLLHRSAEMNKPIETPCISVCVIEAGTRLCAGCGRSLDEIARWAAMTDAERQRIMRDLALRRARARPSAQK
jgi:predicted Fe-S protein YdhL (DUF1289 family)